MGACLCTCQRSFASGHDLAAQTGGKAPDGFSVEDMRRDAER